MTALFSREEGGERVQPQVDNLPNEHGGSSISGFGTDRLVALVVDRDKLHDRMTSLENSSPSVVSESLLKRQLKQPGKLAEHLELFLNSGCSVWTEPDGGKILLLSRALVGQIHGLTMRIYSDEHAPPHFHVKSAEIDAAFRISDCSLLRGSVNGKTRELIDYWYLKMEDRSKLIEDWNKTRPTDCPVGKIQALRLPDVSITYTRYADFAKH